MIEGSIRQWFNHLYNKNQKQKKKRKTTAWQFLVAFDNKNTT
jgi:hypothetical protein